MSLLFFSTLFITGCSSQTSEVEIATINKVEGCNDNDPNSIHTIATLDVLTMEKSGGSMREKNMKISNCKFLAILIILLGISNNLNAQVSLGLQGGVNISKTVIDNEIVQPQISSISSFTFGAIINYKINSIISLQSELRYLQSGNEQNLGSGEKITDYFNYLKIPIYAVATLPNLRTAPFILAGINFGYLLKSTSKYYFHNFDFTQFYNRTNISFDIGVGVKHSIFRNVSAQLSGRYSYGIYNIEKELGDRKTRGIQVLLGFLYDI